MFVTEVHINNSLQDDNMSGTDHADSQMSTNMAGSQTSRFLRK